MEARNSISVAVSYVSVGERSFPGTSEDEDEARRIECHDLAVEMVSV